MTDLVLFHYTDRVHFNAIRANSPWVFKARHQYRSGNPRGAYFTNLPPSAKNLGRKLRVGPDKREFYFSFAEEGDLRVLSNDRGKDAQNIFYSPQDYYVEDDRQRHHGETVLWK